MTLQEAHNFFESLKNKTTKKTEVKVYEKFIHMLTELKKREFSIEEIQSIETELDRLNLKSAAENRKKHFKKIFNRFSKFLKETFSITPRGHYTYLGISLGTSFGVLFGIVILSGFERSLGISIGLITGLLIGMIIGQSMDARAIREGNVL